MLKAIQILTIHSQIIVAIPFLKEGHLEDLKAGKREDFILQEMPNLKLNLLKAYKELLTISNLIKFLKTTTRNLKDLPK